MSDARKEDLAAPSAEELAQAATAALTWGDMEDMLRSLTPCNERGLRHVAVDLTATVMVCKVCGTRGGRLA